MPLTNRSSTFRPSGPPPDAAKAAPLSSDVRCRTLGGELGVALLYGVYVVVGGPVLFAVLAVRARNHRHARYALFTALAFAAVAGALGTTWWFLKFPEGFSFKLLIALCILPGFILGAALYGVLVKSKRALQRWCF
jgi:hypothetical protein